MTADPAIKSYFFGKGYRDLKNTISDSWNMNIGAASHYYEMGAADLNIPSAFHFAAAFSIIVFGTAFFLIISAIHVTVLGIFFSVIYACFTIVYVCERLFLTIRRFFAVCPACHTKMPLPAYLCDSCGAAHYALVPSSFGILHHRCTCGQRLPATFFLNRGRLVSKCPDCGHILSRAHTESKKLFVPVVGGPSAGKTAFMVWLVDELFGLAGSKGSSAKFLSELEEAEFTVRLQQMRSGRMPDKTVSTQPFAMNLLFSQGKTSLFNLYLYDPAGEAYLGENELIPHRFLEYCTGILFLIDPFSLPSVRQAYLTDPKTMGAVNPSALRPDDILERLLVVLEKHFGQDAAGKVKIPLAVVLTKVDACHLDKAIEATAPPLQLSKGVGFSVAETKIRAWLKVNGMGPLLDTIDSRFSTSHYFTVSSVGLGTQETGKFVPYGVLDSFKGVVRPDQFAGLL